MWVTHGTFLENTKSFYSPDRSTAYPFPSSLPSPLSPLLCLLPSLVALRCSSSRNYHLLRKDLEDLRAPIFTTLCSYNNPGYYFIAFSKTVTNISWLCFPPFQCERTIGARSISVSFVPVAPAPSKQLAPGGTTRWLSSKWPWVNTGAASMRTLNSSTFSHCPGHREIWKLQNTLSSDSPHQLCHFHTGPKIPQPISHFNTSTHF